MSLHDKRDDFPFSIHNYPHLDSNVPCMPTYGVYISQLIRFAKACDTYTDFLRRHQNLVRMLAKQGFKYNLLCKKFKQFYRSNFDIVSRYSKSVTERRRSGQSVTATDFGSNGPRFESGRGRCIESLDKALYSQYPKEKPSH